MLPLSDGVTDRIAHLFLPWPTGASRVELRPGERVFEDSTPVLSGGFGVTAHLGAPLEPGAVGVLAEQGDYNGGWVWYLADGTADVRLQLRERAPHRRSPSPSRSGRGPCASWVARRATGWTWSSMPTGSPLGEAHLPHPWPGLWTPNSSASLLAGVGRPLPVCDTYDPSVPFSGSLDRLVVEADGGSTFTELAHQVDVAFRNQ